MSKIDSLDSRNAPPATMASRNSSSRSVCCLVLQIALRLFSLQALWCVNNLESAMPHSSSLVMTSLRSQSRTECSMVGP